METIKPIVPFLHPLNGEINLPGSKSITNRALILAALSKNWVKIHQASFCEDTLLMVDALKKLGFLIKENVSTSIIEIEGTSGIIPNETARINVGNAGTVARFLTAILCLHPNGIYHLDCAPAMRKRPIKDLLEPLQMAGAISVSYHNEPGFFPFTLMTHGFHGDEIVVDSSKSSQILSALLFIAPLANNPLTIKLKNNLVSSPFIQMSLKMMAQFGQTCSTIANRNFYFEGRSSYNLNSENYFVELDITAASYFLALTLLLGGQIRLPGLSNKPSLQGDIAFEKVLAPYGLRIQKNVDSWLVDSLPKSSLVSKKAEINFNAFSDTFPTFAVMAPFLKTPTHIYGIAHTRYQESDRISAVATELRKINQNVLESSDSLIINPNSLRSAEIDTYEDHRIAMSFAILGSYNLYGNGTSWISVRNPNCCAKTFPNFFNMLDCLRN